MRSHSTKRRLNENQKATLTCSRHREQRCKSSGLQQFCLLQGILHQAGFLATCYMMRYLFVSFVFGHSHRVGRKSSPFSLQERSNPLLNINYFSLCLCRGKIKCCRRRTLSCLSKEWSQEGYSDWRMDQVMCMWINSSIRENVDREIELFSSLY